ncbi:hypothetical protein NA56DRAFT_282025 [Hyaloscypha hepaticicola]|uniref:C2H2-type domain-containing protein n=1 Tax=Hyaloscypha hepaticicola TaxID=2082293 RepID=A0A2J6PTE1_9HELO|nr:hypothetical protein NA56DRAFT_282025 [Hyaloscypha hepaticicola]
MSMASSIQDLSITSTVSDIGYPAETGSSVYSTPRPLKFDREDDMSMRAEPGERTRYYCTFPTCKVLQKDCKYLHKKCDCPTKRERYWPDSRVDIKRHEEGEKHWPQETYPCLQCFVTDQFGMFFCSCCSAPLVGDHRAHYLQCELARGITRKFSRKDHLLDHLQKQNGLRNMGEHTRTWSLPVDSDWPRQCGFCGDIFDFWEERMAHVSRHFEQGFKIQDWKLPFLDSKDPKPPGLFFSNYRKDEDEDEEDDDDDGFGGGGGGAGRTSRGLASCYGPTSSIPDATAQHGESSSSQQYGTYPGGNYQCQCNVVDDSDPASVLEADIKIFSSKDAKLINATVQFDTGTSDNWISAALVERLTLSIYESPFKAYKTLRGKSIQSSAFVLGVNWTTVDGVKFFMADFQVVTQDASFEVLIGMRFIWSVDKNDSVFNPRSRSQDPSHKQNCQLWRPFKTSLDLETYLNKYVGCQEEFRDQKATWRPFKPNVALERYLNDPADRVQGLSALRQTSSQQRKQERRRDPRTDIKAFLKHGTEVVLPSDFRISFSAQQYIHEHWDDLDHGVLWVNSKIHPDIKSSFLDIAHLVIVRYLDGDSMMTSLLHRWWQNIRHSLCQLPPLDQGSVSNDATNYLLISSQGKALVYASIKNVEPSSKGQGAICEEFGKSTKKSSYAIQSQGASTSTKLQIGKREAQADDAFTGQKNASVDQVDETPRENLLYPSTNAEVRSDFQKSAFAGGVSQILGPLGSLDQIEMMEKGCQSSQSGMPSQVGQANPCISSNLRRVGNIDGSTWQQITQSHSSNARNDDHRDLRHRLLRQQYQTSHVTEAELGDDSAASNDETKYVLHIKVLNLEGSVSELVASVDTGCPQNFIFASALEKIGKVTVYPIPNVRMKLCSNLLNSMEQIVPQHYVLLRLWNESVELNDTVHLKVLELPKCSSGFHIILGQKFLRKHDPMFLAKVIGLNENDPQSTVVRDNWLGTLLKGKTSQKRKIQNKDDDKFREQNFAKAVELYKLSGMGTQQHTASATWTEISSRSQNHSAQTPEYRSGFESQSMNTSSTQFTENTEFSVARLSTASSISSLSSVPAEGGKLERYTGDFAVPQELSQHKYNE